MINPADLVIGQVDFTHNTANQGGSPAANTLSFPIGFAYDGKRLFISDYSNNRILVFNNGVPTTNNASADMVIGQADFVHGSANQGGTAGANTFNAPTISMLNNQLFVGEELNNRVLIFNNIINNPGITLNNPPEGRDGGLFSFNRSCQFTIRLHHIPSPLFNILLMVEGLVGPLQQTVPLIQPPRIFTLILIPGLISATLTDPTIRLGSG